LAIFVAIIRDAIAELRVVPQGAYRVAQGADTAADGLATAHVLEVLTINARCALGEI
jgi:hypothetical protein